MKIQKPHRKMCERSRGEARREKNPKEKPPVSLRHKCLRSDKTVKSINGLLVNESYNFLIILTEEKIIL